MAGRRLRRHEWIIICSFTDLFFIYSRNEDLYHRSLHSAGGWFDSVFSYPSPTACRQTEMADRNRQETEKPISAREERDIHPYMYIIIYVDNYDLCDTECSLL